VNDKSAKTLQRFKTWVKLIRYIPYFQFVFLLTAFVPVDSPTLTTQFYTFVRYFLHILFSILPHSLRYLTSFFFTFLCRYWPVLFVILHHLSTYFLTPWKKFPWVKLIRYRTLSLSSYWPPLCLKICQLSPHSFTHYWFAILHLFFILPYTFTLLNRFLILSNIGFALFCCVIALHHFPTFFHFTLPRIFCDTLSPFL